ncbi:UNVERIFIED_CONTAM: hypothetical protein K2H54_006282 [Gekko kuhli]
MPYFTAAFSAQLENVSRGQKDRLHLQTDAAECTKKGPSSKRPSLGEGLVRGPGADGRAGSVRLPRLFGDEAVLLQDVGEPLDFQLLWEKGKKQGRQFRRAAPLPTHSCVRGFANDVTFDHSARGHGGLRTVFQATVMRQNRKNRPALINQGDSRQGIKRKNNISVSMCYNNEQKQLYKLHCLTAVCSLQGKRMDGAGRPLDVIRDA